MAGEKMDRNYIAGSTGKRRADGVHPGVGAGSAGDDGLRVVGINPGAIATDRLVDVDEKRGAANELGDESRWEEFTEPLPMGRAGTPAEIGMMVAFLASGLVGLHNRDDHHHRRRRGQSRADVLRGTCTWT